MAYTLFGIPNCDTVKKARTWLNNNHIEFEFHNYKTSGISVKQISLWLEQVPLKVVFNKASATYRKLTVEQKSNSENQKEAISLLVESPSMIKRPVLMKDNQVLAVGFKPELYEPLF